MTDLVAIVRATRRSAAAIKRMQHVMHELQYATEFRTIKRLDNAYRRAELVYQAAQHELDANPLPGDRA